MMKRSTMFSSMVLIMMLFPIHAEYIYYDGLNSKGGSITKLPGQTVEQLKVICDSIPNCVGFNAGGWIKNNLRPRSQWNHLKAHVGEGIYVKIDASDPTTNSTLYT